jgi:integrase
VRFKQTGDPTGTDKTFETLREARALKRYIEETKDRGAVFRKPSGMTLAEWWVVYTSKPLFSVKLTRSTQEWAEGVWNVHIKPRLGRRKLASLTTQDVESWITDLLKAGVGPSRVNAAYRVLRRMLYVAVQDGEILANPAVPEADVHPFMPEQVRKLLDAVEPRDRALLLRQTWSGTRIGEAAALREENLDLDRRKAYIKEAYSLVGGELVHGKTKSKKDRLVSLPPFLVEELRAHLAAFPPTNGLVFAGPKGGILNRNNLRRRCGLGRSRSRDSTPISASATTRRTARRGIDPSSESMISATRWCPSRSLTASPRRSCRLAQDTRPRR